VATASKKTVARAGRRTKAEVEKEFASVQAEVERARQEANPKNEESRLLHEAEVRAAVEAVTVEGVVQRISSLGLDVSKALGGLSEQLREEVGRPQCGRPSKSRPGNSKGSTS